MLANKMLDFIEIKDSFTWKEFVNRFHLDVENINQLREYLILFERLEIIKVEICDPETKFIITKKLKNENKSNKNNNENTCQNLC